MDLPIEEYRQGVTRFYSVTPVEVIEYVEARLLLAGIALSHAGMVELVAGDDGYLLNIPNETTFFAVCGMFYTPPTQRTLAHFEQWLRPQSDLLPFRYRKDLPKQRSLF